MQEHNRFYEGTGKTLTERRIEQPIVAPMQALYDPRGYLAEQPLVEAVNVAIELGMPLLLTGEPGTGKTQLAGSVAFELEMPLLTFHTKSTSTFQDLLYKYDALRHFKDVQLRQSRGLADYIDFGPLGKAILLACSASDELTKSTDGGEGRRSVVLIDEVDKAPRDFSNDILNELETLSFVIKETDAQYRAPEKYRPIVILTSNLEKDLPDPFRRRCVFYNIGFPSREQLENIVRRRLQLEKGFATTVLAHAIEHFLEIRDLPLEKRPSTAELIRWIDLVRRLNIDLKKPLNLNPEQQAALLCTYSLLAKGAADFDQLKRNVIK
jgi:MoxR-like ATPase